jgi:hypothetical protein
LTTPFKITFRKKVKDIPNSEILNNFKVNFERAWCDKATIINFSKLIVENEFIRIKPDLNWNLWVGIGKAEINIKECGDNNNKSVSYTFDFTKASVTFILETALILFIVFFNNNISESEFPIFKILLIVLLFIGIIAHVIIVLRHLSIFLRTIKKGTDDSGNYDWKTILKEKTDKELYEISNGNTHLPKTVSKLANDELEIRGVNFENK